MTLAAIGVLAIGTYLLRLSGPLLRKKLTISSRVEAMFKIAATVILAALIATSTIYAGNGFAGWALVSGVGVGGVLAWRKAPFAVVVIAAAGTTAILRAFGIN